MVALDNEEERHHDTVLEENGAARHRVTGCLKRLGRDPMFSNATTHGVLKGSAEG